MNEDVFREAADLAARGERGVLAIVTKTHGSGPQIVGAKLLLKQDGSFVGTVGGGAVEAEVLRVAHEVLQSGEAIFERFDLTALGMRCGGQMDVYVEPIHAPERLYIYGGGHIAAPLADMAFQIGFCVTVVDDRTKWANRDRFTKAAQIVNKPYGDALTELSFSDSDYHVIVTHGHEHDQLILEFLTQQSWRYVGMIGSRAKVARSFEELRKKGIDESVITSIHAPIGLKIGSKTPAELAVSICAELIQVRHQSA